MKHLFVSGIKAGMVGLVLAASALTAEALTLGRIRGAAWIGQPLDLVVSVELDAGAAPGPICQEAEVFYADSRQDAARVRTSTEPTGQANVVNLRVTSSTLIDEPVVTVYLRAGCGQKTARRYVLLADYANESASAPSRALTPVAPQVPTVSFVEPAPPAAAPAATQAAVSPSPAPATTAAQAAVSPAAPLSAAPGSQSGAANPSASGTVGSASASALPPSNAAGGQATLATNGVAASQLQMGAPAKPAPKVEAKAAAAVAPPAAPTPAKAKPAPAAKPKAPAKAPEPASGTVQVAKAPSKSEAPAKPPAPAKVAPSAKAEVAATQPGGKTSARADTGKPRLKLDPVENTADKGQSAPLAVELPKTEATDAQAAEDAKRMEELQSSLKVLLDQSAKNEATLLALRERLERAESDRVPMVVVYALAGLLILAMAAVVYLWNRRMNEQAQAALDAEATLSDPQG